MSAVPQKKLCWNCEGNISREIDNCPYCGVYLHLAELEEDSHWNPSYSTSKTEEIPTPIYQVQEEPNEKEPEEPSSKPHEVFACAYLFTQLKRDVFPTLFLMMGSVFFLFGVMLLLFTQNGTLTLQWQGYYGYYFLLFAIPLVGFGWRFLQRLEPDD